MGTSKTLLAFLLCMVISVYLIIISFMIEPLKKTSADIYSSSISEIISTTPTTMPSQAPVVTVEPLPTQKPIDSLPLPKNVTGLFKAWEDYNSITREDSKQYALKQFYWVDMDGFCRLGEYYAIAMGTFYAEYIGQTFIIELESRTIKVIVGDVKWKDCIDKRYSTDGSILEFIVNTDMINSDRLNEIMAGKILRIAKEK